jgi:hypothetical protein
MKNNVFVDMPAQRRRAAMARYFLWEYGYDERRQESRERAVAELAFAFNGMRDAYKPNTLRK